VTDLLLYETSDPQFANRAIEALTEAGISCYRTGTGYFDITRAPRTSLGLGICIFLRRTEDYRRANEILIGLGAVVDSPPRLPSQGILFILALVVAAIAAFVATNWKAS
jgi:hypothetical protein